MAASAALSQALAGGVLAQLAELSRKANAMAEAQESSANALGDIANIKNELLALRRKERELKTKVTATSVTSRRVADDLAAAAATAATARTNSGRRSRRRKSKGGDEPAAAAIEPDEETLGKLAARAATSAKEHREAGLETAYRLAGRTTFGIPDDPTSVGVRFDTCYNGKFFESYYVVLKCDFDNRSLAVTNHSLPYFVPLDVLETQVLSMDVAAFIDRVGDYLDAFVSRREQIREARRAFRSQLTRTDTNAACDALTLALETDDGDFEVDLSYEELRSERPVKVSVFARRRTAAHADHDDDDEMVRPTKRQKRAEESFRRQRLVAAVEALLGADLDNHDGDGGDESGSSSGDGGAVGNIAASQTRTVIVAGSGLSGSTGGDREVTPERLSGSQDGGPTDSVLRRSTRRRRPVGSE